MAEDSILSALQRADQRAIRTVDALTEEQWREPSVLPGWTRAHVVAHLALNAEGFARALDGVKDGSPVATYDSLEARDADIEELAAGVPTEIRARFLAATSRLRHAFGSLTEAQWSGTITRYPDGPPVDIGTVPGFRRYEVEIHHADLEAGYSPADWPAEFTTELLDLSVPTSRFTARATDLDRSWSYGADSPVVSGSASALAWWLIGRGRGQELTSDHGSLPEVGPH